jgi:hypothetical protein
MGQAHMQSFKCPHCEYEMNAKTTPPNFTAVPGPAPANWVVAVISCSSCSKAIGVSSAPVH